MESSADFKSLLERVADDGDGGLYIYAPGSTRKSSFLSYRELRSRAKHNARRLRQLPGFKPHGIFLLHFDNHEDGIVWFWSVAYANCVPTMSTPFSKSVEGRQAHIQHLHKLLDDPVVLTRQDILPRDFADNACLNVNCVDDLQDHEALNGDDLAETTDSPSIPGPPRPDGLALLMLTSGSTGNAKAVCLSHRNLLAASKGKAASLQTPPNTTYFNFIGMDHVAALIETHLHALQVGASQVHVQAADLIPDPLEFIRLADKHRVSRTLAPNFFLAKLRRAMEAAEARLDNDKPDLSCLTHIASGGEANLVETADVVSRRLQRFGAPPNCIVIAWGMTETCAGTIFNLNCPKHDLEMGYEFASVGKCCPGIEMRISPVKAEGAAGETTAVNGVNGSHVNGSETDAIKSNETKANAVTASGTQAVGIEVRSTEVNGAMVNGKVSNGTILKGSIVNGVIVNGIIVDATELDAVEVKEDNMFENKPNGNHTNGVVVENGTNGLLHQTSDSSMTNGHDTDEPTASQGQQIIGNLEVRGEIVFERYYNNPEATKKSFTADGWFNTEDLAMIDEAGHLNIVGRTKDTMTINGVKYLPHEIEFAVDEAGIPGVAPSFTACFSQRFPGASTEHICIVYLPTYAPEDVAARMVALDGITKIVALQTSSKPQVLPLDESCLQKTTLGKLSRSKLKNSLEQGKFARLQEVNEAAVSAYREEHFTAPADETEERVLRIFEEILDLEHGVLGVETPYFEAGLTSIDLIKIRRKLEIAFEMTTEIPMITMMTQSTIRALSKTLTSLNSIEARPYNPVVTLNHTGSKTPLFLIHPGVGEILVFFGLVKFLDDRPVHAIRARGFNKGEPFFNSIDEVIETYYAAIRQAQPHGPYALAGYSWGSMLAFELAKKLETDGETVGFLGAFNLPPHIKWRMRQFDWVECVIHLAYFSDLISEESTSEVGPFMRTLPTKQAQLEHLISISNPDRWHELALSPASLENWADVAFSLQSRAVDYEPLGRTSKMDVFYCRPLKILGITKQQWKDQHLRAWEDYVEEVKYHEVDGAHYTMLLPEHVGTFQKTLKKVLKMRGM